MLDMGIEKDRVAIIGTGRTGSSLLFSLLSKIEGIAVTNPKEFLNQRGFINLDVLLEDLELIVRGTAEFTLFTHVKTQPSSWDGDKFRLSDGISTTVQDVVDSLKEIGFTKFIHIKRDNLFRWFLSVQRGWGGDTQTKGGGIVFRHKGDKSRKSPIIVDPIICRKNVENAEEINRQITEVLSGEERISLTYDIELQDDYRIGLMKIVNFVGIDLQEFPDTSFRRTNPYTLQETIENYEDFEIFFKGTKWEWMLNK